MMDEAFKRRLSGQYFVGRPSPEARKIMLDRAEKLYLDENMKQQLVMMTSNFSGAALKQLISDLVGGFIDGSAGS
jgi:SpoVK/Ycf46/Vps4 family AAA+-type ATPase